MIGHDMCLSAAHVQVLQLQRRGCDEDGNVVCEWDPRLPHLQCVYDERLKLAACTSPS